MKPVSIIIPVKNSQRTIKRTVDSILAQDYAGQVELILVGDHDDPTWKPIASEIASGVVRAVEVDVFTGGRDSNYKRNEGLKAATHDTLVLTDSDMVLPETWLSSAVRLLGEGYKCVAGPMASVDDGFWGRYVDDNPFASKTPRMEAAYVANRETLGRRGYKPPVTANVAFEREVYETVGGLDPLFVHSYEDYEWFQRMVDADYEILCTPELVAEHYHRQGWRQLLREYHRSGRGCAQFVRKHPESHFSRSRSRQLSLVCTVFAALLLTPVAAVAQLPVVAFLLSAAVVGTAGVALVAVASIVRARRFVAASFPAVTFVLGCAFSYGMLKGMLPELALSRRTA